MSSEVQLTYEAVEAFVDLLTEEEGGPSPATVRTILRSFEVAVRAQWAAELERLHKVFDWNEMALGNNKFAYDELSKSFDKIGAERDFAQTEVNRLREALSLMVALYDEPAGFVGKYGRALDDAIAKQKQKVDQRLAIARAALQPGASQARTDGGAITDTHRFGLAVSEGLRQGMSLDEAEKFAESATPPGNATQATGAREPLTREQAIRLWGNRSDGPSNGEIVAFARAIEAAHGIASSAAELKKD